MQSLATRPLLPARLLASACLMSASCWPAWALDVGTLRLEREPNRPLRGEILLSDRAPVVATELKARIAARETFKVAGMDYHPGLAQVQLGTRQLPNGRVALTLDQLPSDAARLDLLLTISDRATLTIAEYRIDLKSLGTEFPPARAGSALAAQQRGTAAPAAAASAAPSPAPAPATAATSPAPVAPAPAVSPAPGAKPQPSVTAAAPASATPRTEIISRGTPSASADASPARAEVEAAVRAWAAAWSRRDVSAYLAAYSPDFTPAGAGLDNAAWAAQRRQRIEAKSQIDVRVERLELDAKGNDWVASFVQHYRGDSLRETTRKQLLMRRSGGRWLIVGERVDR